MARELITDDSGKVTAVSYIDKLPARTAGALPHRGAVGGGVRVGPAAAQLEVAATSAAARQRERPGRQIPHRHRRFRHVGEVPALAGTPVFNSDGYGAHLYIPWWMLERHKELDFPRGYHVEVGGGGFGMPGLGFGAGTYNRSRGLRPADEEGDPRELRRHHRQPEWPRRDGPERGLLLRDRSRPEGQVGDPGAALPLEVERLRDQPGEAHARVVPRDPRDDRRHGERRRSRSGARPPPGQATPGSGCDDAGPSHCNLPESALRQTRWAPAAA